MLTRDDLYKTATRLSPVMYDRFDELLGPV